MENRGRKSGSNRNGPEYAARRKAMAARREKERKRRNAIRLGTIAVALLIFVGAFVLLINAIFGGDEKANQPANTASLLPTSSGEIPGNAPNIAGLLPDLSDTMPAPQAVEETKVGVLGIEKDLNIDGNNTEEYTRQDSISFSSGANYTELEGVITFRGNNYRDTPAWGTASVAEKKLEIAWGPKELGNLQKWTGSGWTGQPLIVKWPEETKKIMNLYEDKKTKADLVEVIYATMDGKIHFYDLDDGTETRDPIDIGQPFKGAGSLDPRGIPMIYLGSGDKRTDIEGDQASAFIYSLVDGTQLHKFGGDDEFSQRTFVAWDSSALVSAETDTLIYPGENGILYTMKLNTQYDKTAGTLSIAPNEVVKMRYTNKRHRDSNEAGTNKYWLGMESSAVTWKNYLYITDNCGDLLCIDLNHMKVIWAQDTLDDTNCTPVFDVEANGQGYIYISTSLHWTQDEAKQGKIPFMKINASTGEIVQKVEYDCHTVDGTSGGMQATALLGRKNISDLVIANMARTPKQSEGMIYALDKNTFEEKWQFHLETVAIGGYSWSSPIAIYDENGDAYIVLCNTEGIMFLLDGSTGKLLDQIQLSKSAIEASPAAYGNTIVVGTRGKEVFGVRIK